MSKVKFHTLLENINDTKKIPYALAKAAVLSILENKAIDHRKKIEGLSNFCNEKLDTSKLNGQPIYSLKPSSEDYQDKNLEALSIADMGNCPMIANEFFKALDNWFAYSFEIDKLDKTVVENKTGLENIYLDAAKKLQDYKEVWDFYKENPELTEYQELGRDILKECEQNILGNSLQKTTAQEEYAMAGEALQNLVTLHKIGIPGEELKLVYNVLKPLRNKPDDEFKLLARKVYQDKGLTNEAKAKCLSQIALNYELPSMLRIQALGSLKCKIERTLASANIDQDAKDLLGKYAEYQSVDATKETEVYDEAGDRAPAYKGETLIGFSPMPNFFDPHQNGALQESGYMGLYHSQNYGVIERHQTTTELVGQTQKRLSQDIPCLFIKAEGCSRRHSAFTVDSDNNIWLRHTSEKIELGVFRKVIDEEDDNKEKLIKLPTFGKERLKLKKGDVFFIGNLEFELSEKDEITVRKLNMKNAKTYLDAFEQQADIEQDLDLEQIYAKDAPVYKLKVKKPGFDKPQEVATTTITQDLIKQKGKIFKEFNNMIGLEGFIDLSSIFFNAINKERTA